MALTLTRRESSPIPLEVFGLTPEKLFCQSTEEICRLKVRNRNRVEEVGEHFSASGRVVPEVLTISFAGDCSTVHGIGAGMKDGIVRAESVGMHAGAKMSGGSLQISGSAGDWLGAEMSGGRIEVRHSARNRVGAAYSGSRRGMCGGRIVVRGGAGVDVGLLMRRGLIIVEGRVGEFCGASMIAGTIIAGAGVGPRCGAGMKRGTILAVGPEPEWAPGFVYTCEYRPAYAEVMWRELKSLIDQPIESIRLYRGDQIAGGRGEIWHVPQTG
jgi:formylmethanofuran dehydrogenase subunit C